jgi:hypothetical protein
MPEDLPFQNASSPAIIAVDEDKFPSPANFRNLPQNFATFCNWLRNCPY